MKTLLATTAAIALGLATGAQAQSFTDQLVADLEARGFVDIEVEVDGDKTIIEGVQGDRVFEFTYDTATQELLEEEDEPLEDEDEDHEASDEEHEGEYEEEDHEDDDDDDDDDDDEDGEDDDDDEEDDDDDDDDDDD